MQPFSSKLSSSLLWQYFISLRYKVISNFYFMHGILKCDYSGWNFFIGIMPALDNEFTIQRKPSEPWFVLTLLMIKKKTFFYQWVNAWLIEFLVIFVKFKVDIFCYKGLNRNSINAISRLSKRKVLSVFSGGLTESFTAPLTSPSSVLKVKKIFLEFSVLILNTVTL